MTRPVSLGRTAVGLNVGLAPVEGRPLPETPFRIVVLGDFANPGARGPLAERRPVRVDRDNFDAVLARLRGTIELSLGGPPLTIRLRELDDFHPDHLFQNLDLFRALRELRADLANPATFEAAAARLRGAPAPAAAEPPAPVPADPAALLNQILGGPPSPPQPVAPRGGSDWQAFLQQIVGPHLVRGIDQARQAEMEAAVDQAIGTQMRALLHHPAFQSAEAAWRAVHFLTRRLDTDSQLQIHLLDVSRAELATDISANQDPTQWALHRLLLEPGGNLPERPWGLVVGLYPFGPEDAELLHRLGWLVRQAGAPFLAEASSTLLGSPSLAKAPRPTDWQPLPTEQADLWKALRQTPEATSLGLALPRFLLRLPYGKESSSAESFDFEELPGVPAHESYLWGNPAVVCAYLIGESFSRRAWDLHPGDPDEVGSLPVHVYRDEGESQATPCAEVVLTERAVEAILQVGLMPLLCLPGRDTVRVGRFASLAAPLAPLAGRWSG